MSVYGSIFVKE